MLKKKLLILSAILLCVASSTFATTKTYALKTSGTIDTNKGYLIVYQSSATATSAIPLKSSFTSGTTSYAQCAEAGSTMTISSNQITTDETNDFSFESTGTDGSYYIKNNSGYYFGNYSDGSSKTGNWFAVTNTSSPGSNYYNTVSFSNSTVQIVGSYNNWVLGYTTSAGGTSNVSCFHYMSTSSSVYLYEEVVKYTVTCETAVNGTVSASPTSAVEGATITLTVTPDTNYELDALTVTDASGNAVEVSDGTYTFTMPASNVTVSATFKEIPNDYTRTVTPGTYQSFCLPFDVKLSALTDYFDKVYRISGNYVEELPNCHDDLDNVGEMSSKSMMLAKRKAAVAVTESTDLDDYSVCDTPFALYINTKNYPNTFHVFLEEMPETDLDDNELVLEANIPFYALVKDGVTTVTLSPEGEVTEPAEVETILTTYNYVAGSSTTVQLSDVGTTEDVTEENTVYAYNEDGTFTKAESNTLAANCACLLGTSSDLNIIVHYGYYGDRVEMVKAATVGDANRDGDVDTADAVLVINKTLDSTTTIDEEAAEVNEDGVIDTADAVAIINICLNE